MCGENKVHLNTTSIHLIPVVFRHGSGFLPQLRLWHLFSYHHKWNVCSINVFAHAIEWIINSKFAHKHQQQEKHVHIRVQTMIWNAFKCRLPIAEQFSLFRDNDAVQTIPSVSGILYSRLARCKWIIHKLFVIVWPHQANFKILNWNNQLNTRFDYVHRWLMRWLNQITMGDISLFLFDCWLL